ncbi:MAG: hypothetical protein IKO68_08365 [Oscillospiraceae bacterium]|nr:hypothetical protein [Oscillospiraceae bacterium]
MKRPTEHADRRRVIWHVKNKDPEKHGVVSSVKNCGYTERELQSMAEKGYYVTKEEDNG